MNAITQLQSPPRARELFYVHKATEERGCYWIHGLTFREFFAAMRLATPVARARPTTRLTTL
jgi:hypothetical protein